MNQTNAPLKTIDLTNPEEKLNYNRTLFDTVAPKYDLITSLLSFGQDQRWKRHLIKSLPQQTAPKCLDLACGTADITKGVSQIYSDGTVIGLDLNEKMIKQAKLHSSHQNITFELGDMCSLKHEDESFDIVTGGYALRNAPDLSLALKEVLRVMKPGASAAFLDFSKPKNRFLAQLEYLVLLFWGNLWGILFHGKAEIYGYIAESLKRFPHREAFEIQLKQAGFVGVKSRTFMGGMCALTTFSKELAAVSAKK